jgi:putative glutamine amidotransferase
MIKKVFLSLALGLSYSAYTCELPQNEVIKIGCSSDCDFFYRFRILTTAWTLGYKAEIKHLIGEANLKEAMSQVDALLIPGGADIDPKYYLDSVTPELREYTLKNLTLVNWSKEGERRDPFEYALVKTYTEDESFKDKPLLGICRGMQMMSVAQGIPLYLDIKTEVGIKNRKNLFDRVSITHKNSLMDEIYLNDSIKGFKAHHQGIRVPYYLEHMDSYANTNVTAFSNDRKIAEAIEYTHRPALGVQYHPEKSFTGTSAPVFRWFLTKACEYKNSRKE